VGEGLKDGFALAAAAWRQSSLSLDEVHRYRLECPYCGSNELEVVEVLHEIPFFGKVILSSMRCSRCGYRKSDVANLEFKPPARYELKVEGPEDLNVRVVRSSTATIQIPELGIEVKPGPIAEGFISNVEGVLHRVKRIVEQLLRDSESPEEAERAREVLHKIERALQGEFPFTLIIDDPYGNSFIAPKPSQQPRS